MLPGNLGSVAFGNVAANYDPASSWRPYSATSTWNQRLSNVDNPTRDPNDYAKIQAMFNAAFGGNHYQGLVAIPEITAIAANVGSGVTPYYFARNSDPLVKINCTAPYGSCQLQGRYYYIPAKAVHSQNTDHHIAVIQPSGDELDVWEWGQNLRSNVSQAAPWTNGETVYVGWGSVANVTNGSGWGSAATESGAAGMAGIIREPEIASGLIAHALTANVFCSPTANPIYPATHAADGQNCNGFRMSSKQITNMGARLWIDLTDSQINELANFNAAQKIVLHALHDYGAFVTGENGYNPIGIAEMESQIPGAEYGNDVVGAWSSTHLPEWYQWQGLSWYYLLSTDDLTNFLRPHLHVLAPCVNDGFPGARC